MVVFFFVSFFDFFSFFQLVFVFSYFFSFFLFSFFRHFSLFFHVFHLSSPGPSPPLLSQNKARFWVKERKKERSHRNRSLHNRTHKTFTPYSDKKLILENTVSKKFIKIAKSFEKKGTKKRAKKEPKNRVFENVKWKKGVFKKNWKKKENFEK